jgi:hypothetical protein
MTSPMPLGFVLGSAEEVERSSVMSTPVTVGSSCA